jgi:hypothetical protein
MNYYDDMQYASGRLSNTIVNTVHGFPVYVERPESAPLDEDDEEYDEDQPAVARDWDAVKKFFCYKLSNQEPISLTLEEIDLTPVRLGLIDTEEWGAVYITRLPVRGWKQGLSPESFTVFYPGKELPRLSFPIWGLYDTIQRNYCTYDEALEKAKSTGLSRPFSPKFSVGPQGELYYKCLQVGKNKELDPEFFYLEQYLDETLEGDYAD